MLKFKRFRFWFIVFSIQILMAAIVPTAVLMLVPAQNVQVIREVSGFNLDYTSPEEARETLNAFYQSIVREGEIILESEGKHIKIPFSDIELQIDAQRIFAEMERSQYENRFFQMIGKTNDALTEITPEIFINEARFRDIFSDIRDFYHNDAINAGLVLQQGTVSVTPSDNGLEIDMEKALRYIRKQMETAPSKELRISQSIAPELFNVMEPQMTTEQLQSFTQLYSLIEGEVPAGKTEDFKNLVQAFEKKVIKPGETFSFKERMASFSETNPLQQLLASCIYQAILPVEAVKVTWREPANQPVSGIEAGLEVNLHNAGDLQFQNTSPLELILVFEITENGQWNVALAGKPGLRSGSIKTEYTTIPQSVIYSQDASLPENMKEVREPGKEGLSVKIYRVVEGKSDELYENIYQPVHKIVAIGSGVKKEDIVRK